MMISAHTNTVLVNIASKAFSQLISGKRSTYKGLSEGRGALNQQKLLKAHESWFYENKRY